jgi:hypothetical protein
VFFLLELKLEKNRRRNNEFRAEIFASPAGSDDGRRSIERTSNRCAFCIAGAASCRKNVA